MPTTSRRIPGFHVAARLWLAELSERAQKLRSASQPQRLRLRLRNCVAKLKQAQERIEEAPRPFFRKAVKFATGNSPNSRKALFHVRLRHQRRRAALSYALSSAICRWGHSAYNDGPKGDILYQFRKDVNEGKLPHHLVAYRRPRTSLTTPVRRWYGAWYVSEVMDILTRNPEVWKKTIFILTYDENDGYFDHAPSFVAADPRRPETGGASAGIDTRLEYTYKVDELAQGVADADARTGPIGLGFAFQ